jgi:transcriptional regulator with XRE-family HTH domain
MAEKVGIDRSFLADVERGKRNISILNLELIAEGLGLSLSRMLSGL